MMWRKTTQRNPILTGLSDTRLAGSRDSAGFSFGAVLRKNTATVSFRVENPSLVTSEMISDWENRIAENSSVIATEFVSAQSALMSATVAREDKEERREDTELLTRLAIVLPEMYGGSDIEITPLTETDIAQIAGQWFDLSPIGSEWPDLGIRSMDEELTHLIIGNRSFASFDVLDDADADEVLRQWCLHDLAEVGRWNRIFRPAAERTADNPGRHSGILTISVPTSDVDTLELVVDEVLSMLTPAQRLRVRRLFARQSAGATAGIGLGAFAWDATATLTARM